MAAQKSRGGKKQNNAKDMQGKSTSGPARSPRPRSG